MEKVHFIGIGGTGLSAIARVLLERGYRVSGSDQTSTPVLEELKSLGAEIYLGHSAENLKQVDLVIRSSAIPAVNQEVLAALSANIPVLKRSEMLTWLLKDEKVIAIAGTHGKTTTTAMMAWTLNQLGYNPSFIIGSVSKDLGCNAHAGQGEYFVIEADEYDYMFHGIHADYAVITSLEHDHPDCFPTFESYTSAFETFADQIKPGGKLIVSTDNAGLQEFLKQHTYNSLTYGLNSPAEVTVVENHLNDKRCYSYTLAPRKTIQTDNEVITVELSVPGLHNLTNSLAVLAVISDLGLSLKQSAEALSKFSGTGRRFDVLGEVNGIVLIDDYGHHPTEIKATLEAAKQRYPNRRLWAVWQPHTYSRTITLIDAFEKAFDKADLVIITDIYAARETNEGFSSSKLAKEMGQSTIQHIGNLDVVMAHLLKHCQPGDVVIVLSAGDANQITAGLFNIWQNNHPETETTP